MPSLDGTVSPYVGPHQSEILKAEKPIPYLQLALEAQLLAPRLAAITPTYTFKPESRWPVTWHILTMRIIP